MSLEALNTLAACGTFVVIAATAIAAAIQLRHMRAGNQIQQIQTIVGSYESSQYEGAFHFARTELHAKLADRRFRQEIIDGRPDRLSHPELRLCTLFDQWGSFYRNGAIDKRTFMQGMAGVVVTYWELLEPVIALSAQSTDGVNVTFESFEVMTVCARDWLKRYPRGTFPRGMKRLPLHYDDETADSVDSYDPGDGTNRSKCDEASS
jgi:hypothetical protein